MLTIVYCIESVRTACIYIMLTARCYYNYSLYLKIQKTLYYTSRKLKMRVKNTKRTSDHTKKYMDRYGEHIADAKKCDEIS